MIKPLLETMLKLLNHKKWSRWTSGMSKKTRQHFLGPKKNGENFTFFVVLVGYVHPFACQPQKEFSTWHMYPRYTTKVQGHSNAIRSDPSRENLPKIPQKEAGPSSRGCIRENERNLPQRSSGWTFSLRNPKPPNLNTKSISINLGPNISCILVRRQNSPHEPRKKLLDTFHYILVV